MESLALGGVDRLAVGRIAHLADAQSSDGWVLRAAASFGIAWWVVPENVRADIGWLMPAFAAVIFANWLLLESLGDQPGNAGIAACLTLALLIGAGVLVFAGIARYMEAAIIVAMGLTGITAIASWRNFEIGAVMPVVAVFLPGVMLVGNRETSVETIHWAAFALPALAPLVLAASLPFRDWTKGRLLAMRVGLILIPLVIAMALAQQGGSLDFGDHEW